MTDEPWWHDDDGRPGAHTEGVGSAAEEAARLFTAMRDRLLSDPKAVRAGFKIMETMSSLASATLSSPGATPVAPGGAPECAYCPVCQAMRRAQAVSPEAVERLTGAALEFAETVRTIVGQGSGPAGPGDEFVRHVPLDEDFEGWPEPVDVDDADNPDDLDGDRTPPDRRNRQQPGTGDQ